MMGFGMLGGMFLFWVVLIVLAVLVVRGLFQSKQSVGNNHANAPLSAFEIIEQRYARGEIDRAQFDQIRRDLS